MLAVVFTSLVMNNSTTALDNGASLRAPSSGPQATHSGPVTSFSDGTYLVGTDIVAGTYHTTGPASYGSGLCYWEREKDTSGNFDSIIANNLGRGPATVTISSSDGAFKTSGCST